MYFLKLRCNSVIDRYRQKMYFLLVANLLKIKTIRFLSICIQSLKLKMTNIFRLLQKNTIWLSNTAQCYAVVIVLQSNFNTIPTILNQHKILHLSITHISFLATTIFKVTLALSSNFECKKMLKVKSIFKL